MEVTIEQLLQECPVKTERMLAPVDPKTGEPVHELSPSEQWLNAKMDDLVAKFERLLQLLGSHSPPTESGTFARTCT
jgi:hypothetical protein